MRKYGRVAEYLIDNVQLLIESNDSGFSALEGVLPDLENRFHSDVSAVGMHDFREDPVRRLIGREVKKVMGNNGYPENDILVPINQSKTRFFKEATRFKRL